MISLAKKIAKKAQHTFASHAAIVLKGGAVLSTGYNHDWIHAELNALSKIWLAKRKGCVVWSLRFTKTGRLANAKPCGVCEQYMVNSGVKAVFYSNSAGTVVRMNL